MKILSVEVKDVSGNYFPLKPLDSRDLTDRGMSPTEYQETDGLPYEYDLIANSLFLYPQPAADQVTLDNGLKVKFQRGPDLFVVTDTTKVPGFASLYHKLIPLIASYDYAVANEMTNKANFLLGKIEQERTKMKKYFSKRDKAERSVISMRRKSAK